MNQIKIAQHKFNVCFLQEHLKALKKYNKSKQSKARGKNEKWELVHID